jgi:hypothetical protein
VENDGLNLREYEDLFLVCFGGRLRKRFEGTWQELERVYLKN